MMIIITIIIIIIIFSGGIQIHSVAETLLIFLDSLPEPVVPHSFYDRCLESTTLKQAQEVGGLVSRSV